MQLEVAERLVAKPRSKAYGILSVVFQLYTSDIKMHFKISPTVFYPVPKVQSALLGLQFLNANELRVRFGGVKPNHLRKVVNSVFKGRRKILGNGIKDILEERWPDDLPMREWIRGYEMPVDNCDGDDDDDIINFETIKKAYSQPPTQHFSKKPFLPKGWIKKRPEELTPAEFVELTRLIYGDVYCGETEDKSLDEYDLGEKVWRKMKHGIE